MIVTMSIDPGVSGSGYAIWSGSLLKKFGICNSRAGEWQQAGHEIAGQLHSIGREHRVEKVFCEYPAFFQGGTGQVTARSGSLVKLAWFVGFVSALFESEFTSVRLIEVNHWKGQLPKDVVERRVRRILRGSFSNLKSHAVDAVGIGLFVHGRMK